MYIYFIQSVSVREKVVIKSRFTKKWLEVCTAVGKARRRERKVNDENSLVSDVMKKSIDLS